MVVVVVVVVFAVIVAAQPTNSVGDWSAPAQKSNGDSGLETCNSRIALAAW